MKEKFRKMLRAIPYLLLAAVILALVFYPAPAAEPPPRQMIEIWNVDTFDGGKGSRTAFLGQVARSLEKEQEGVWCLVTGYTKEGAEQAFLEGRRPDLLSFGPGLDGFLEYSLPLPYTSPVGEIGGSYLCVPWCMGGYYLFSMDGFEEEGKTAISSGRENLSCVAAALAGIQGEEVESSAAYIGFLQGGYKYLLGTQRDICRFETRGVSVQRKPLSEYCDLYQCISVLSAEKRGICTRFIELLLSDETAERLSTIGMQKPQFSGKILSVFASQEAREQLAAGARQGDRKFLEKFLKTV